MTKTIDAALLAHIQSGSTSLAYCMRVTRIVDGQEYGFTDHDRELTIDGLTYEPGLDVRSLSQKIGLAGNNLEITALYDGTFIRDDFLAGYWHGAEWEIFQVNWADLTDGTNPFGMYVTMDVKPGELAAVIELFSLGSAYLKRDVGAYTSRTCRAHFADYPEPVYGQLCRLSPSDFVETGTITNVTSQQVARDSARAEAADYFGEGLLTFNTGDNAYLSRKIKTHAANGTFTFSSPFPSTIQVGDAYTVIAGCRKRRTEDCFTKFDNVINFQGEPDTPGIDDATSLPSVSAV